MASKFRRQDAGLKFQEACPEAVTAVTTSAAAKGTRCRETSDYKARGEKMGWWLDAGSTSTHPAGDRVREEHCNDAKDHGEYGAEMQFEVGQLLGLWVNINK
eukprot:Skav207034  [mRNA]  locus=scaffold1901:164136:170484:- [translate_table: standard]